MKLHGFSKWLLGAWFAGLGLVANAADVPGWKVTATKEDSVGGPATLKIPDGQAAPVFLRIEGTKSTAKFDCQVEPDSDGKLASTIVDPLTAGENRVLRTWPVKMAVTNKVLLVETGAGLEFVVNGKPFTTYRHKPSDGPKPFCWPIFGPTGKEVTRDFPMVQNVPGETRDHIHHRSMWFTHGKVNGNDFWSESPKASKEVHRRFVRITSGPVFGEFVAVVDWIARDGKKVCEDTRRMRVWATQPYQMFDFEIVVKATEGDLVFGDDKEGTFGFRVASSMDVKQKNKGTKGGTIVNSNGIRDGAAWAKRAAWVDYSGPVGKDIVGITVFDSPKNFRHPTHWHVRDYGLFAANPFGWGFFEPKKDGVKPDGTYRIPAGGEMRLSYRVVIHEGGFEKSNAAGHFASYSSPPTLEPVN